jgi:hypothetical protein
VNQVENSENDRARGYPVQMDKRDERLAVSVVRFGGERWTFVVLHGELITLFQFVIVRICYLFA